jgi:hypothetical protein
VRLNRRIFRSVGKSRSWKNEVLPILKEAGYKGNGYRDDRGLVYWVAKKPRDNKALGLKWTPMK